MNKGDLPRIAATGRATAKLLDTWGFQAFVSTKEWQTPLRSPAGPGPKNSVSDPTGTSAILPDPLALEHGNFTKAVQAYQAAAVELAAVIERIRPLSEHEVNRGRVVTIGSCIVCEEPGIKFTRGMCDKDHRAWHRAGCPDVTKFKRDRQRAEEQTA